MPERLPKLELVPTRSEARVLVISLLVFWSSIAVAALAGGRAAVVVIAAIPAGLAFYWTLFRVAGRETDRPPQAFFFGALGAKKGDVWATARDGYRAMFKILSPAWHLVVVRQTGWNVPLTVGGLIAAFLAAGVATISSVGTRPPGDRVP